MERSLATPVLPFWLAVRLILLLFELGWSVETCLPALTWLFKGFGWLIGRASLHRNRTSSRFLKGYFLHSWIISLFCKLFEFSMFTFLHLYFLFKHRNSLFFFHALQLGQVYRQPIRRRALSSVLRWFPSHDPSRKLDTYPPYGPMLLWTAAPLSDYRMMVSLLLPLVLEPREGWGCVKLCFAAVYESSADYFCTQTGFVFGGITAVSALFIPHTWLS